MRTTKAELLEIIKDIPDSAEIVLKVRCNSTTDYAEQSIIAFENSNGVLIIKDNL